MKALIIASIASTLLNVGLTAQTQPPAPQGPSKPPFTISSPGFEDGGVIPDKFTAPTPTQFQNSPPLVWRNTPEGTASFVLLVHDLDGAINHRTDDVTHWLIYNIPGTANGLSEGVSAVAQLPDGSVQAPNQRKTPGYLGPGARGIYHHYSYELFALDTKLSLPIDAPRADVFNAMQGHVLGKAVIVGKYVRKD